MNAAYAASADGVGWVAPSETRPGIMNGKRAILDEVKSKFSTGQKGRI
jgi:hypothetical protein